MNWKNYFYFSRGDKVAILILLTLIMISGIAYIITKPSTNLKESLSTALLEKKFDDFQTQLASKEKVTFDKKEKQTIENESDYPIKLKEGETIEINNADTADLKKIPGIGSAYAKRIVKYRNLLGGFVNIDQLKEVWGIDDLMFEQINSFFTLDPNTKRTKVNKATVQELNKHPYITYQQAQIILDIRTRKGNIKSTNRLSLLEEFSESDIERLRPYLDFD